MTREIAMKKLWERLNGSSPFFLMTGPNVLQSMEHTLRIAERVAAIKETTGLEIVFKVCSSPAPPKLAAWLASSLTKLTSLRPPQASFDKVKEYPILYAPPHLDIHPLLFPYVPIHSNTVLLLPRGHATHTFTCHHNSYVIFVHIRNALLLIKL